MYQWLSDILNASYVEPQCIKQILINTNINILPPNLSPDPLASSEIPQKSPRILHNMNWNSPVIRPSDLGEIFKAIPP